MFRKILAFLLGHRAQIVTIATRAYNALGRDILRISDEERRTRITAAVKAEIEERFPQYEPYADIAIDYVVAEVRKALKRRKV